MNLDRAKEIVSAISDRFFLSMGLTDCAAVGSLEGVSLADMLAAKAAVEAENARQSEKGGRYTIMVVPDDRLIAAAYALDHFPESNDAIVVRPDPARPGSVLALVVGSCRLDPDAERDDEGDDE